MSRCSFRKFLTEASITDDPAGDLIADMRHDRKYRRCSATSITCRATFTGEEPATWRP